MSLYSNTVDTILTIVISKESKVEMLCNCLQTRAIDRKHNANRKNYTLTYNTIVFPNEKVKSRLVRNAPCSSNGDFQLFF